MLGVAIAVAMVFGAACAKDDGAGVRTIGESPGAGSGSGSGSGSTAATGATGGLGAYTPGSDVTSHAAVSKDVCDIAKLLPETGTPDYAAATKIYSEGANATKSDST